MKSFALSAVISIAALSSYADAAIKIGITKGTNPHHTKRQLLGRQNIIEELGNNFTGQSYMATVTVGTPPQDIALAIDTGSSDTWVLDSEALLCTDETTQAEEGTGCQTPFDSGASSTFKVRNAGAFDIEYGDGSSATGDYFTDDFTIGEASINNLIMGIAHHADLTQGLLGIGYSLNEASNSDNPSTTVNEAFVYPNIIDAMVEQNLIAIAAYSLYLDSLESESGSIIFGGLDKDKFQGDLVQMPVVPRLLRNGSEVFTEFAVALTSFSLDGSDMTPSGTPPPVVLDSGTSLTYLPSELATAIYTKLNAFDDSSSLGTGLTFADCNLKDENPDMTLDFGFGGTDGADGVTVKIPLSEMILAPEKLGFDLGSYTPSGITFPDSMCVLGIISASEEPYILGDTFLRSAYVVYDLKNNVIAIAQTNFNSDKSDIVDFEVDQTSIPAVSGVASDVGIVATDTGLPGGTTQTASGTQSSSGATRTPTSTKGTTAVVVTVTPTHTGAAVASVPTFDVRGLFLLGGSAMLAMLGGGWLLA